jgi:[ribosomal protein S5]-alanine N-acetyltransferase
VAARTRDLVLDDAPAIARLVRENRDFLGPWEPLRDERWFTDEGQHDEVGHVLGRAELGLCVPRVVLDGGEVVGRITLNTVVRGAFQSCSVGYWLAERATGRGLATEALGEMLRLAFGELSLHRVEAGTLVHNVASQRVLAHHGFTRFGLAPQYLKIAGRWQDHVLFQLLDPATA